MKTAAALVLALLLATAAEAADRFGTNNGLTSGTCTTQGTACRMDYALTVLQTNETLYLLDGVYQGAANMMQLDVHVPGKSGSAGNVYTVRALNDGGVFIDGQFTRYPFGASGHSYWSIQGIDFGNADNVGSGSVVMWVNNSNHMEFKRVCASNLRYVPTNYAEDVIFIGGTTDSLFEDVCAFGVAGNNIIEYSGAGNNTFRRLWIRWEGQGEYIGFDGGPDNSDCGGPPFQIGYGAHQTSTYENVISVYDPEQVVAPNGCLNDSTPGSTHYGTALIRDSPFSGDHGYTLRGWIAYGKNTTDHFLYAGGNGAWFNQAGGGDSYGGDFAIDIVDFFVDALSLPNSTKGPIGLGCTSGFCTNMRVDRITSLRGTASSIYTNSGEYATFSNINECTTAGACPNFYTGASPGTGARNCFEYTNGTLTSTPLWPWRMDDRIKAALNRARSAGTGGSALAGTFGPGYDQQTVTSEIVSRYGSVPAACLRGTTGPAAPTNLRFTP